MTSVESVQTVMEASGLPSAEVSSEDASRLDAGKLRVFISYSRKDAPFVDRLAQALEARDIEVFVDRRDLPFLTKWQEELVTSIAASDAVVYVISPSAAESEWCQWEVDQVVSLKKRLAPVVATVTPLEVLPEAVRAIQLLPMTEGVDFDRQSDILAKALKTDLTWIKEHTRIAERAYRWEASGRADASLLRGRELEDAELWISSRPRDAPEPTILHRNFVQESRLGEQKRMAREREQLNRTRRFQRRFAEALTALSALVLIALIAVLWQMRSTFTREAFVFASQAEQAWSRDECDRSARYALAGLPDTKSNPLTPWSPMLEASLVRALWPCRLVARFTFANQQLHSADFAADGKRAVVSAGKEIVIVDFASGTTRRLAGHTDEINDASFSEDGQRILSAGSDGTVRVWNAVTGSEQLRLSIPDGDPLIAGFFAADRLIVSFSATDPTKGLLRTWDASTGRSLAEIATGSAFFGDTRAFATHGSWVLTKADDKSVAVWDVKTGQKVAEVPGDDIDVRAAAFSPGGERVVVGGSSHQAHVWNLVERKQIAELRGHENAIEAAAFSPDGRRIVTGSWDGTAIIWNATSGEIEWNLRGHDGAVVCVGFSPDGDRVVTASRDATVRVWDTRSGRLLGLMKGHDGPIRSCASSRDGTRAVTLSEDQTVRAWDTTRGRDVLQLLGHTSWVRSVAFSPDGKQLATSSDDGTLRLWSADDGHPIKSITTGTRSVEQLQFSSDGKVILTADGNATASLWGVESGQLIGQFVGHAGPVRSAAMSPDGSRVVTASGSELGEGDSTARIWDAVSLRELLRLEGHGGDVLSAAYSPDGKFVVTGGEDKTARIWDAMTGALLKSLEGHGGAVYAVAFSPDSRLVVTGSADGIARIWEVATGRQRMVLKGHGGWVTSVSFSRDASRVLTAGPDHTARIWDVNTGIEVARLASHDDAVRAAAFSPDGQRVATASDDGTARIWDVAFASTFHGLDVRTEACRRLTGATAFTDTEMLNPIFRSGNVTRDVCSGAGNVAIASLREAWGWIISLLRR
jgi:WD40 repeat protein